MKELLPKPIDSATLSKDIKEAITAAHVKTNETVCTHTLAISY